MLDALIFDFDGVVIDSEPIHMDGFQHVMRAECGVEITAEQYYTRYLAYCDADAFAAMGRNHGLDLDDAAIAELTQKKTARVQQALAGSVEALPGVVTLMRSARAAGVGVAICSGALRAEVELPLRTIGADGLVQCIISAEDVPIGKPDPAGYRLTRETLAAICRRDLPGGRCVAIEDSPYGVVAAAAAGMAVLAVTNSVPADQLTAADRVVPSLTEVTLEQLGALTR